MPNLAPFDGFIKNKDVESAVKTFYSMIFDDVEATADNQRTSYNIEQRELCKNFLNEITKTSEGTNEIAPDNKDFLLAFMNEFSKKYNDVVVKLGKKRDTWRDMLLNGKVQGAELIKGDRDIAPLLAHDIVLEKETDAKVIMDVYRTFMDSLKGKTIDGKDAVSTYDDINKTIADTVKTSNKVYDFEYDRYIKDLTNDKAFMPDGYRVNPGPYIEGEEVFKRLPSCMYTINFTSDWKVLEDMENAYDKTINEYRRREQVVKSSIDLLKQLLLELNNNLGNEDKSKDCQDTIKLLNNYIKLSEPNTEYSYNAIKDATDELVNSAKRFSDEINSAFNSAKKNIKKGAPIYDKISKTAELSKNIFRLTETVSKINEELEGKDNTLKEVKEAEIGIKYIVRKKNALKYEGTRLKDDKSDGFKDTLNAQINLLSDSLIKDCIFNSDYEELINALKDNIVIEYRLRNARKEEHWSRYDKIEPKYKDSIRSINTLIDKCVKFENNNKSNAGIFGKAEDRTAVLDRIKLNVSRKPNNLDISKINTIWSDQINDRDELWLVHTEYFKNSLKQNGNLFSEKDRVRLGFNIDGEVNQDEEEYVKDRQEQIFDDCTKDNTIEAFKRLVENMNRNRIKSFVNMGKDYLNIYNALEDEEQRDLKARFLFYKSHGNIDALTDGEILVQTQEYIFNNIEKTGIINEVLADKDLTFDGLFDKLGFSKEDKEHIMSQKNFKDVKLDDNVNDKIEALPKLTSYETNADSAQASKMKEFISSIFLAVHTERAMNDEISRLSEQELKYYKSADINKKEEDYKEELKTINDWIKQKGQKYSYDLSKINLVDKIQRANAVLNCRKLLGVDPSTEIGRFYHNNLKSENTYIRDYLKNGMSADDVIEKIVSEKKYQKLVALNPKKVPVNYDTYIELHTAGRGGDTPEQMIENLTKTMAAAYLQKKNEKFDVKKIHKIADRFREMYSVDVLKADNATLREALRGKQSAKAMRKKLRNVMYKVEDVRINEYTSDMKKLLDNMWSPEGRSEEYNNLYNAVQAASEINGLNIAGNQKSLKIIKANRDILNAAAKYIKGKEKVRRSSDGNARFANALDSIAVVFKHAPRTVHRVSKIVDKINNVRGAKAANDAGFINKETLMHTYGANRAENAKNEAEAAKQAKNSAKKRSPQAHL